MSIIGKRGINYIKKKLSSPTPPTPPSSLPTGMMMHFAGRNAPATWIVADGKTIGSSASGATALAGISAQPLYIHLWNEYSNSELTIQTATGLPTSRGITALDDWNAEKRLPLPNLTGKTLVGLGGETEGNLTAAISGINGDVLGASGGDQRSQGHAHGMNHNHSATTNCTGAHTHFSVMRNGGNIDLNACGTVPTARWDTDPANNTYTLKGISGTADRSPTSSCGGHTHTVTIAGFTGNTTTVGAGSSENVQPTHVALAIIKL